jgi:DNA-binding ferritin-like protein (Dps family)
MATTTNGRLNGFVKESLEQAQVRLEALEKEASKVLEEVKERSKSSRKEVTDLLTKIQGAELFETALDKEKELEKEFKARAEKLSGNLAKRFNDVQEALYRFAGVASREQLDDVVAELEKLSRKIEKLSKGGKAGEKSSDKPAKKKSSRVNA